jgi:hypothetical protein
LWLPVAAQTRSLPLFMVDNLSDLTTIDRNIIVFCKEDQRAYWWNGSAWVAILTATGGSGVESVNTRTGAVTLVKADVGLANADDTSDANKPISTATQTALDLKLNTSAALGYSINVQALTSSPADAQTIYFGMLPKAPVTAAATSKVHIRKAGTIKIANIYCYSGTAGTNENWSLYIRLNNTTDTLIATVGAAASERIFNNSSLSIAVVAGDYVEIKAVNPTWTTNPLTTIMAGYLYIEQ